MGGTFQGSYLKILKVLEGGVFSTKSTYPYHFSMQKLALFKFVSG